MSSCIERVDSVPPLLPMVSVYLASGTTMCMCVCVCVHECLCLCFIRLANAIWLAFKNGVAEWDLCRVEDFVQQWLCCVFECACVCMTLAMLYVVPVKRGLLRPRKSSIRLVVMLHKYMCVCGFTRADCALATVKPDGCWNKGFALQCKDTQKVSRQHILYIHL